MRLIDADKIVYTWQIDADGQEHDGVTLQSIIGKMPTIEPERKKGMWDVIQGDRVVCSECGMPEPELMTGCLVNRHLEPIRTNFCPNCGSQMERGGET